MAEIYVSSGVTSTGVVVNQRDMMYILTGGKAVRTTVISRGILNVSSAGRTTSTTINATARFNVYSGGTAIYTKINDGIMNIGGLASYTTLNGGNAAVNSGGSAYDTTVGSGILHVSSGGVASKTTVNGGELRIYDGGAASNTTLYGGGMSISSGGTATGKMFFSDNAVVSAFEGSIFNFDISGISPDDSLLLNNLSIVQGTPTFTLTVSGTQADGRYCLAEGATGFNKTITVQDTSGTTLDTLSVVDGTKTIGGKEYTLSQDESALFLTIGNFVLSGDLDSEFYLANGMYGSGVNILNGGTLYVSNKAKLESPNVDYGGKLVLSDGTATDTTVYGGGSFTVCSGWRTPADPPQDSA